MKVSPARVWSIMCPPGVDGSPNSPVIIRSSDDALPGAGWPVSYGESAPLDLWIPAWLPTVSRSRGYHERAEDASLRCRNPTNVVTMNLHATRSNPVVAALPTGPAGYAGCGAQTASARVVGTYKPLRVRTHGHPCDEAEFSCPKLTFRRFQLAIRRICRHSGRVYDAY